MKMNNNEKKKMEKERSDRTLLFSAVTDVRLQTERDEGGRMEERPQGSWRDVSSDVCLSSPNFLQVFGMQTALHSFFIINFCC